MALYLPQQENKNTNHHLDIFEQDQLTDIRQLNDIESISYAFMLTNQSSVAIKKIKTPQTDRTSEWKCDHIYNHPNIVEFLGFYSIKDENQLFSIMPFANDGNLRNYIGNNALSFDKKIEIAINITNGIKFLHENDIIHENINPKNILIFDGIAKISNLPSNNLYLRNKDLYFDDDLFDNIGYIEPSSIFNENYMKNKSVDIYSLGTLLWEIMSEKIPYSKDRNDNRLCQLIIKIRGGYREVNVINNPEYTNLYKNCWNGNNLNRPKIDDVYNQLLSIKKLGNLN
ncbi:kinase-like domain-containing protein [Glomus cerebriforme]|uniref:Kinase-like domain-containing protein n=1 Tax=Glomus cerebriforme TaxID=658196 RepID=A0A397STR2_9GLOM|nr:kinase-like domain-containing protein [Glomus cerebriforme]